MNKTMYLAWQDTAATRQWFPIGRLNADQQNHHFDFVYTRGAEVAQKKAGLEPLEAFPDFRKKYEAAELFPLFRNRLLQPERSDFSEYLRQLDIDPANPDPLEILAITGGERQTDNFEVFPRIVRQPDGCFCCRFFIHGLRHVNDFARERLNTLKAGDELRVAIELNNPATICALQVQTPEDYYMVGWAPRYLVPDLVHTIDESPTNITARVVQVNPPPAPIKQRVLVEMKGHWPADYQPMSAPEFEALA
jgi:hypothetical protein